MKQYVLGYLKSFLRKNISIFAVVDAKSIVHRNARVYRFAKLVNSSIDKYTYVGPNSTIVHSKIGAFCSISNDVQIGMGKHPTSFISTSPIFYSTRKIFNHIWSKREIFNEFELTQVGNDVWIGMGVQIHSGVEIGDGAIIASAAVVTKNVPAYAIVGGVPAKILKYRFGDDIIFKLGSTNWWKASDNELRNNICAFQRTVTEDVALNLNE